MARSKAGTADVPDIKFEKPTAHADELARLAELRFRQTTLDPEEALSRRRIRRKRTA